MFNFYGINKRKINFKNLGILAFNKSSYHYSLDTFCKLIMSEVTKDERDDLFKKSEDSR